MNAETARVVVLDEFRDSDASLVCLPEGSYEAIYDGHKRVRMFNDSKVGVDFRLVTYPGITLTRWYRAKFDRNGRVWASNSSDIVREISAVLGTRVRRDRVPITELANRVVLVEVHTVKTDRAQRQLAKVNEYSKIERLVKTV